MKTGKVRNMTELTNSEKSLYLRVYSHYREMIDSGLLKTGARLPSVRQCAKQLQISRTTVESAYMQRAADGYVISKPQSGYYVTERPARREGEGRQETAGRKREEIVYDFSAKSVDRDSFDFNIWRRYIKSALRQDERLLSYGEPQGEWELRQALADYVAAARNVICRPEQIVIGAGTQCLLQVLCPMLSCEKVVSFPTHSMVQGITIFRDFGYEIHYKDKDAAVIYVSPSRMNRMGDVMPVSRRLELLHHAASMGSLIIEDDYESEFQDPGQPIPSLFGLSGGRGVVYLGTCSRLLLPSIRLSYMVLPLELLSVYEEHGKFYNQTASKAEQIALCQFIRDGHMEARIRKIRRLYRAKTRELFLALEREWNRKEEKGETKRIEAHNLCITIRIEQQKSKEELTKEALALGIRFDAITEDKSGNRYLVLSSLSISPEIIPEAAKAVRRLLNM